MSYASLDMQPTQMPLRQAIAHLRWLTSLKSLVTFFSFYACYVFLTTIRMDWWQGHQTLTWFQEAHADRHVTPLYERNSIGEIADYIDKGISPVVSELQGVCAVCEVGITSQATDMGFLGLEDFICSDFDSQAGSNSYPSRNCAVADAAWASNPTSTSAPCCHNTTLVTASIAMMTEALAYGKTHMPVEKLLSGGTDPSYSSTEYFIKNNIKSKKFIMQVMPPPARWSVRASHPTPPHAPALLTMESHSITSPACHGPHLTRCPSRRSPFPLPARPAVYHDVPGVLTPLPLPWQIIVSRSQRMVGTTFSAPSGIEGDAPRRVETTAGYWSFNYAAWELQGRLRLTMFVLAAFVLWHDLRELRVRGLVGGLRHHLGQREKVILELPSVMAPIALELARPFMQLPDWIFWIVCTEMVMSARLFQEGKFVPALRRLVRVVEVAAPNVVALVMVFLPIGLLTAAMYAQLFGLFDEGFAHYSVAITRVVRMLTAPPEKGHSEGEEARAAGMGTELMYYWSTLVVRLCFGSFIVAILVGAFNKVMLSEASEKVEATRDNSLPAGFVDASDPSLCHNAGYILGYLTFGRVPGGKSGEFVNHVFMEAIASQEEENPKLASEQVMVGETKLSEMIGDKAAHGMLQFYGAARADQHGGEPAEGGDVSETSRVSLWDA